MRKVRKFDAEAFRHFLLRGVWRIIAVPPVARYLHQDVDVQGVQSWRILFFNDYARDYSLRAGRMLSRRVAGLQPMAETPPQYPLRGPLFGALANLVLEVSGCALSGLIECDPVRRLARPAVMIR